MVFYETLPQALEIELQSKALQHEAKADQDLERYREVMDMFTEGSWNHVLYKIEHDKILRQKQSRKAWAELYIQVTKARKTNRDATVHGQSAVQPWLLTAYLLDTIIVGFYDNTCLDPAVASCASPIHLVAQLSKIANYTETTKQVLFIRNTSMAEKDYLVGRLTKELRVAGTSGQRAEGFLHGEFCETANPGDAFIAFTLPCE